MLDIPGDHAEIVNLLSQFDLLKPKIFSEVITRDFKDLNRVNKKKAVEKFAIFWKLATQQSKKKDNMQLPEILRGEKPYIPFQPDSERKLYEEGVIVGEEDEANRRRDYDALHKMLEILEDKDPTLRLAARSWLQESRSDYCRIIDPLLKEFMSNSRMHRSVSGQLFHKKEYNAEYVKENFAKLKNIILTTQEEFVEYILLTDISDYIEEEFNKIKECMEVDEIISQQFYAMPSNNQPRAEQ